MELGVVSSVAFSFSVVTRGGMKDGVVRSEDASAASASKFGKKM